VQIASMDDEDEMSVYRTMLSVLKILPHLDAETQQKVIRLVEEWGPKLECAETGATLVDDATIRAIVAEQRHGVSQGGMVAQSSPKQVHRGTGWQSPPKPEDRTRQFAVFDAMVDHMVGSANDTSKLR